MNTPQTPVTPGTPEQGAIPAELLPDFQKAMISVDQERVTRPEFNPSLSFLQRRLRWGFSRASMVLAYIPKATPTNHPGTKSTPDFIAGMRYAAEIAAGGLMPAQCRETQSILAAADNLANHPGTPSSEPPLPQCVALNDFHRRNIGLSLSAMVAGWTTLAESLESELASAHVTIEALKREQEEYCRKVCDFDKSLAVIQTARATSLARIAEMESEPVRAMLLAAQSNAAQFIAERDAALQKLAEVKACLETCENGHGMQAECYGCQRDKAIAERDALAVTVSEIHVIATGPYSVMRKQLERIAALAAVPGVTKQGEGEE